MGAIRELFKVLPLGVALPVTIGAASIGPEDAGSNLSKWAHLFGVHDIPAWLTAKTADHQIIGVVIALSLAYAIAIWGIPFARQHWQNRALYLSAGIIAGSVVVAATAWGFWPLSVNSIFRSIDAHAFHELGAPATKGFIVREVSRGRYQFSTVLWENNNFYLLHDDGTWAHFPEREWASSVTEPYCYYDNDGQRYFQSHGPIPHGLHSPRQGVCRYLENNPDRWKDFGWMKWSCQLNDKGMILQYFENGLALGVFPIAPDNRDGQVFVLYYDNNNHDKGKWRVQNVGASVAPTCSTIDPPGFKG